MLSFWAAWIRPVSKVPMTFPCTGPQMNDEVWKKKKGLQSLLQFRSSSDSRCSSRMKKQPQLKCWSLIMPSKRRGANRESPSADRRRQEARGDLYGGSIAQSPCHREIGIYPRATYKW